MTRSTLIIFVKAPEPGQVKTRLAETLGAAAAARAYAMLVETLLARLSGFNDVELRYAPETAFSQIEPWLRKGWRARFQGDGNLGDRMQRALAEAFASGAQRAALIGSDCPYVEPSDIEAAWSELEAHDAVFGPAQDGGYWLIGLKQMTPALFESMAWSTDQVLVETLRRARQAGLRIHTLRTLVDVDVEADWVQFMEWQARGRR